MIVLSSPATHRDCLVLTDPATMHSIEWPKELIWAKALLFFVQERQWCAARAYAC